MRNLIFSLLIILIYQSLSSQSTEIWGSFGISNHDDLGGIFMIDSVSGQGSIVKTFDRTGYDGFELTKASDGNYYGLRRGSLNHPNHIVFRVDPNTKESEEIFNFTFPGGNGDLSSGLVEIRPGELWGVASGTGVNGDGLVYSYNYLNNSISVLYNLNSAGIDYPNGNLLLAPSGKVYGLARGISMPFPYQGAIYEIDTTAQTLTTRYRFSRNQLKGQMPNGQLVAAANGMLYGICMLEGSTSGEGTLFEYNPINHQVNKKVTFTQTGAVGDLPLSYLYLASNGKIYGTTERGGANNKGVLFEYTPGGFGAVKKKDLTTNTYRFEISYEDANGRLLGFYSNQTPNISGAAAYNPSSNTLTSLVSYPVTFKAKIYKVAQNRYFVGGEYVYEFDSLFSQEELITASGMTIDGGSITSTLVLGADKKLYSYSARYINGADFYSFNPLNGKMEVITRLFKKDSIWNVNGNLLPHPNGNFYVAFSFNANTTTTDPNANTRAGILELDPQSDSVKIVYMFQDNLSEISSLVIDTAMNFYGLARKGDYRYSRPSYLFKLNAAMDSLEILHSWNSSRSIFRLTDIMIDDNVILGMYNDPYARFFRYFIAEDSMRTSSLTSGTESAFGSMVIGPNKKYFGTVSDRIVEFDLNNNQVSTLLNFNTAAYAYLGSTPSNLSIHYNTLYGINSRDSLYKNNSTIFSVDLTSSTIQPNIVHVFDSSDGRVGYNSKGPGLLVLDICRSATLTNLILNADTICDTSMVTLSVDSGDLKSNAYWALYLDSISSQAFMTDSAGVFTFQIGRSVDLIVRGEGGCALPSDHKTIRMTIDSSHSYLSFDTSIVCYGENYINPRGDTIFFVTQPLLDSSWVTSIQTKCDSLVITYVQVDSLDTSIFQDILWDGTKVLASGERNASYQWIDCNLNSIIPTQNNRLFRYTTGGSYAVIISNSNCVDTTNCIQVLQPNLPSRHQLYQTADAPRAFATPLRISSIGDEGQVQLSTVLIFPNPTQGVSRINFDNPFNGSVKIYNSSWQLIQEDELSESWNAIVQINGNNGLYFIEFISNTGAQLIYKIVKE